MQQRQYENIIYIIPCCELPLPEVVVVEPDDVLEEPDPAGAQGLGNGSLFSTPRGVSVPACPP